MLADSAATRKTASATQSRGSVAVKDPIGLRRKKSNATVLATAVAASHMDDAQPTKLSPARHIVAMGLFVPPANGLR